MTTKVLGLGMAGCLALSSLTACGGAANLPSSGAPVESQSIPAVSSSAPETAAHTTGGDIALIPTDQETEYREMIPSTKLIDCKDTIDGWERTWKEYVPDSYNPSEAVPLMVVLHGGSSHTGHKRTAYHLIADRENFIVLYPESIEEGTTWNVWQGKTKEEGMPDDVKYLDELIAKTLKKYNIDQSRMYITGQSMGDMMCSTYIYERADMFAAAAPLSGPTYMSYFVDEKTGELLHTPQSQLPVVRTHGTLDNVTIEGGTLEDEQLAKRERDISVNNMQWINTNNCSNLPLIGTEADKCIEIYPGDQPFIFYSVEGGQHNPVLDMADFMWTHFFSSYRRENSKIIFDPTDTYFSADQNAIAVTAGSANAYVDNKLVALVDDNTAASCEMLDGVLAVPVTFLKKAFPGTKVTVSDDGKNAVIDYKDLSVEVSEGNRLAVVNNSLKSIKLVDVMNGELMVPFCDIANLIYGVQTCEKYDVAYAVNHDFVLTFDLAYTIREVLGTQKTVTPAEALALAKELEKK